MPINNTRHDLILQRRLTRDHGEYVTHYPVLKCSCQQDGDHPKPTCKVCLGSGRVYGSARTVKGLIAGISAQDKALLTAGIAMPGDMTFSPDLRSRVSIHDYDMIRLGYGQPFEGEIVTRGQDTLSYAPANLTDVEFHNPVSGAVTRYTAPADFTVSGRQIAWVSGRGPAHGQRYSVRYYARYDWVVYPGVTLQREQRGTNLGQRVLLRKRHLSGIAANVPD